MNKWIKEFDEKIVVEPNNNRVPSIEETIKILAQMNTEIELIMGIGTDPTIIIREK